MQKERPKNIPSRCKNCKFWEKVELKNQAKDAGECKRFPPETIVIDNEVACVYPATDWRDWCGEFRLRIDA